VNPLHLRRLRLVALLGLVVFAILLARLVSIQAIGHKRHSRAARSQQTERVILEAPRGRILDRHLRPLADNVSVSRVSVNLEEVVDLRAAKKYLVEAGGRPAVDRLRKHRGSYVAVVRRLAPERELALADALRPQGVYAEPVPTRVYPLEDVARSVVGLVGVDGEGLEGLEKVHDRDLRGENGWALLVRDGRGVLHQLPQSILKLPVPGGSLVSTIDRDAQSIVMMRLKEALQETGARSAMGIFADPWTGDILAMACADAPGVAGDRHRNRLIADQYEPGSTFKILAAGAALEEGILTPEDSFYVDRGEAEFGGSTIHDSHPESGWFTVREGTEKSSNVVYANIGTRVGAERLYRYARLFGFGQSTRIGLPGEAPGQIRHPDRWSARSLATISIGQEVLVTPAQMLMAYCAVANGGTLLRPRLATALLNDDGEPVTSYPVERVRRVLSEATCATFRSFLRGAVLQGTAAEAALSWCSMAGKTGTAQKCIPGRGYEPGRYIASFVGMVPAERPALVGIVILDEPRGAYYGGAVAAPVFRDIVAAWAMQGHGPVRMPAGSVLRREPPRAEPEAPEAVGASMEALADPAGAATGGRFPDLRGLDMRVAVVRATAAAGGRPVVRGSGRVVDQIPAPGAPVSPGARCVLLCAARER
jgi:cell division protein FtsI (penicillin-binding protein 3)